MIKQEDLKRWHSAKTLAILSLNVPDEIVTSMQEMYIELKWLRRDNLKLLNSEELLRQMAAYIRTSRQDHYLSPDLEEQLETLEDLIDSSNYDLEI